MREIRQLPPGRAGRRWLAERLAAAHRAADLLDRKLRILRAEQDRYAELGRRAEGEWTGRCREADRWLLRAALVTGERELRLATPVPPPRYG
jgi:V/A-type H+-transporting ATPase subunit D